MWALLLVVFSVIGFQGCGSDYKDLSSETGRKAIMDDAINYLTDKNCDSAISVLQPLYASQWVNNEVRMLYASAYACQGGLDFPSIISALKDAPSDIWSPLVKANYSDSNGKPEALLVAASIVRQTAGGSFEASARDEDANTFMIILQAQVISTTISFLGQANQTTGNEGIAGWPATSADMYRCRIQSAVATIDDSAAHVPSSENLSKISDAISTLCGSGCLSNKDPDGCGAAENLEGLALMGAISTDWTGP